ncbi:MAG: hypothetical protein L0H84_15100 [Pseudonocardia sp.]|nr:hypothetical protein [Pseudonocardia sp.]
MAAPIDHARRATIAAAINARDGRSRAQLARDFRVAPSTVRRIAAEHGINNPFDTSGTRKATESAADRRRVQRSDLADELLTVEIPRLRTRMAGPWQRTAVMPGPDGPEALVVPEDDATIARGLKDLHTALGIAVDKTIVVDRHDAQDSDQGADDTLARLFDGLGHAYRAVTGRPAPADQLGQPDA